MKQILLCADDYGQSSSISQGILLLLKQQRLSAISCITNYPDWPAQAAGLKQSVSFVQNFLGCQEEKLFLCAVPDIGLHFNLTEGPSVSGQFDPNFPLLRQLLVKSYLRKLNFSAIEQELNGQIDRFIHEMGQLPHFIDGHQHVHHLPIVRDVLFKVYAKRLKSANAYIRCVKRKILSQPAFLKNLIIQMTGGYSFKKKLLAQGIPHNTSFAGAYSFSLNAYRKYFIQFLQQVKHKGLIMCHPGLQNEEDADPIAAARAAELDYFLSEQFVLDCAKYGVMLSRFN